LASLEQDLDRLYQIEPGDFTSERNALAKRAGDRAAEVRALQKPTLPAWAINQLYWRDRPTYDALVEAANDLRATHQAVLAGRRADLRAAGQAHDEALEPALKRALELVSGAGHPLTDATRQAIVTTLRALPGDEPPGRLTRALQPTGFAALAGAAPSGRVRTRSPARPAKTPAPVPAAGARKRDAARLAEAREAVTLAARAEREAEQAVRRGEFEAAKATREAEAAHRRLEDARAALEKAQDELRTREREAAAAVKKRDAARERAGEADAALDRARTRADAAREAERELRDS
jgi:hypothetical protein